jgi:hypothetical protein
MTVKRGEDAVLALAHPVRYHAKSETGVAAIAAAQGMAAVRATHVNAAGAAARPHAGHYP